MAVVTNPLPVRIPREVARESSETLTLSRLQIAVADCVSLIRALFSGRLLEWHEDETIESGSATTIRHGLGRVPRFIILAGVDTPRIVYRHRQQWTENVIVLQASAGTPAVSFVLF